MRISYLTLTSLLLALGPNILAAGETNQSSFIKAGLSLRKEVRAVAASVQRLDAQRKLARGKVEKAAPVIDDIGVDLTGLDGKGGLRGNLLRADSELADGLKSLWTLPVNCDGAKLQEWEKALAAERQVADILRTLAGLQNETVRIKRAEAMLNPVYTSLRRNSRDVKALLAAKVLRAYIQEHVRTLDGAAKQLAAALRAKEFTQVGRLAENWRGEVCARKRAVPEAAAPPRAPRAEPKQQEKPAAAPTGYSLLPQAPRSMPAAAAPAAAPQSAGLKKLGSGIWDFVKGVGKTLKETWDRRKPIWMWKDKKDLSWRGDGGITWQKIEGELQIQGRGDANKIAANDVNQGYLGDCYYLAAMAAVARQKPETIDNMMQDNGDGTYSVTYQEKRPWWKPWAPKYTPKTVTVDNEFPAYNYGGPAFAQYGDQANGKPELWTMIGEKAYAQFAGKGPYLRIEGGFSNTAMSQITGKKSESYSASKVTMDQLAAWEEKGQAMTIHTKSDALWGLFIRGDELYKNDTLVPGHAYYIKEVDKEKGTVTLGNPWGYKHATLTMAQFQKSLQNVHVNPIE
ncbi:MAG: C2 family cysteine protease [Elusimicrobiota bacterium]